MDEKFKASADHQIAWFGYLDSEVAWKSSRRDALKECLEMFNNTANVDYMRDRLHCMINEVDGTENLVTKKGRQ